MSGAGRALLVRLLIAHGADAPAVLWRVGDELEWLEAERAAVSVGCIGHSLGR